MNLLVPAALAFGLIIPIILLLYFMRPKRQQRVIASTLLWQQALQDMQASRPWQRLRITPLLLLQILAAIIIVLILTRPALFGNSSVSGDTIIILQASASMQATDVAPSRFENARADIADIIANLGPNDHLSLITMAHTSQILSANSNNKTQLTAALQHARVTNQDADLEAALSLANSLLAGHATMQVLVVGDGHISDTNKAMIVPFSVHYLRIGTNAPNAALLTLSSQKVHAQLTAFAQVANYSTQSRAIPVELYADGRLIGVQTVMLAAQATGTVQWQGLLSSAHFLHARLIAQDAMTIDHEAWAIVGGSQPARVLLVTNSNIFLQAALALQPNISLFKTTPAQYVNTAGYDLTVFDGFVPATLPAGALFFMNPPPGAYLFGASKPPIHVSRIAPGDDKLNLLDSVDLSSIHTLQTSHLLQPAAWAQSIMAAPETPLLIAGETNNRRIAVLGFDLHNSDLGLQPSFPILIHNLTNWFLPQPVPGNGQVTAGTPVTIQAWPGADHISITGPDQQTSMVGPPFPVLPFSKTDRVGIYQVTQSVQGQQLHGAFTVNLFNPLQSNLAPARTLPILRSSDFSANGVSRQLREIWPWIAALLLLVLCAEWWLFSQGYRPQKATTEQRQGLALPIRGADSLRNRRRTSLLQDAFLARYVLARKRFLKTRKRIRKQFTR